MVLVVALVILAVPDAERASVLATIGAIIVAAAILLAMLWRGKGGKSTDDLRLTMSGSSCKNATLGGKSTDDSRLTIKVLCWLVFFPVTCAYILSSDRIADIPGTLEFGVVTIAVALGGLVLNAGVSSGLSCRQRREFIAVAQKFIIVVILGIIFPTMVWFVDFAGGGDITSFEPGDPSGWVLGVLFWIGGASFFAGVSIFIVALVDLVYAMMCLGKSSCRCKASGKGGSCDARTDADA